MQNRRGFVIRQSAGLSMRAHDVEIIAQRLGESRKLRRGRGARCRAARRMSGKSRDFPVGNVRIGTPEELDLMIVWT